MIPKALIELHAPEIGRGETIRINHEDCPEGQDTKRRLYLTRPASSAGVVLAFCHNCQQSGVLKDRAENYRDHHASYRAPKIRAVPFQLPRNMDNEPKNWPTEATRWRIHKGLTAKQCRRTRIQYDPASHRIYIPQYERLSSDGTPYSEDELLGYQLRKLEGQGAKYLSAAKDSSVKPYTRIKPAPKRVCVLVEDLASGLAVSQAHEDYAVVVNYGVQINPEILYKNINCKHNIVWLDNDGDAVKTQARGIARTWSIVSGKTDTSVIDEYKDPKYYTDDKIKDIIEEHGG